MQNEKAKKPLGFWRLTALLVGNVVGSGIFLLPATLAGFGSISLIAWSITAIGAICVALVFAQLGRTFPQTGGPYVFCQKAFGKYIGFQNAYSYWTATWIGNAAMITAFLSYLSFFWPALNHSHGLAFAAGSAILWILTLINIWGVKEGAILQLITAVLKLLPFVAVVFFGLFHLHIHYLTAFNISHKSHFSAITSTVILTLWAFLGIETATIPGGKVEKPEVNIPRATIVGTLFVAVLYMVSTFVLMSLVPMQTLAHSASPFTEAAVVLFGPIGGLLIGAGAVIAIFGTINGFVLITGQVAQAAASDDLFPAFLKKQSKNNTPISALLTSCVLTNILMLMSFNNNLIDEFTLIIALSTLANIIPYFYSCLAHFKCIYTGKIVFSKPKVVIYFIVTLVALFYVGWAIIGAGGVILSIAAILLMLSYPIYLWRERAHCRA